ncbi:putative disease resistance protein RGA3 [Magnolia sinica]|uniref:putative disease resistance protein RGA3 n=1 Tax=Magnolia sinica TaxID=86752 RepID=UPI00265ABB84|nr:putative disease resistance protein RGA3 [Magnolia sinica]
MVDSLVSMAVEKLNTILQDEVALLVGVTNEIERLSSTFTLIQAELEDAESQRVMQRAVKIWLEKVKDVAYDVDDILDEWTTEALRSQEPDEGDGSCFNKKKERGCLDRKIKEAQKGLSSIAEEMSQLGLRVESGERERLDSKVRWGEIRERETSSILDQPSIVGRENDKNEVLDLLLRETSGEVNEVPVVISIVGMGGLGNTTLAQLIYNDKDVKGHFHMRMWHRHAEERSELEEVGRDIIKKCGGLPLAAKTMGSAMCLRRTRGQWELVLGSQIWNSANVLGGILPALLLSYHDLPPTLKQCFTYCSVFPKDWSINKDVTVKLWVAQGFIRSERSGEMEEISKLYFDDLLRLSLLQDAEMDSDGNIFRCKMHDLVHDLAQSVA